MFNDTITLNFGATPIVFARINQDKYSAEYYFRSDAYNMKLRIRHVNYVDKTRGSISVDRHNVELIQTTHELGGQHPTVRKAYFVTEIDTKDGVPLNVTHARAILGFLSEATLLKLANWES